MTAHQTSRLERAALDLRSVLLGLSLAAAAVVTSVAPSYAAAADVIVTIQQVSSGRYLDAWDDGTHDYALVTRPAQNNASQQWIIRWDESGTATGTLQQASTNRYMDAHEIPELDYLEVTRPQQSNSSQEWQVASIGGGLYTLRQISSNRYMDAHEIAEKDFAVVTRPKQDNATQKWRLVVVGRPN